MLHRPKIIILGAGMSAIACALSLNNYFDVCIYEKSRGVGGRLCAKTLTDGLFHFGAQFCTARSSAFQKFLNQNNAINFQGSTFDVNSASCIATEDYFVAKNGMHSLLKKYNQVLNIDFNHKAIKVDDEKKLVYFESGKKESYDIIISSLPLPQAMEIFESQIEHDVIFSPCISIGMTINGSPIYDHSAYKNLNEDVAWLGSSRFYNGSNKETWVLQFSPATSSAMMNDPDSSIQACAEHSVRNVINGTYKINHSGIFRWRYAMCSRSKLKNKFTCISEHAFAIGDWNISPRVESAFISGSALGEYLVENKL